MLAFDNEVQLPVSSDGCYGRQLALATTTNKEALKNFVTKLPPRSVHRAVYSSAFQRAFQLFSATSNSSESATRKKGKTTECLHILFLYFNSFGVSKGLHFNKVYDVTEVAKWQCNMTVSS